MGFKDFFKKKEKGEIKDATLDLEKAPEKLDIDELDPENFTLEGMTFDAEQSELSNDLNDFKINSSSNKRREHLTAKEDFLLRRKEEHKAKANRKLVNGILFVFFIATFTLGIFLAFPNQMKVIIDQFKYQTNVVTGGILNKDIQDKMYDDFGEKIGFKESQSLQENLSKENLKRASDLGIQFVKDVPLDLTDKNVSKWNEKVKTGNYVVGRDINDGFYYGNDTVITVYDNLENFEKKKASDTLNLNKSFARLYSGQFITIEKKGEFLPTSMRTKNYVPLTDIENGQVYQVGIDIAPDVYKLTSRGKSGNIIITSKEGINDNVEFRGSTKYDILKDTFVEFKGIESLVR